MLRRFRPLFLVALFLVPATVIGAGTAAIAAPDSLASVQRALSASKAKAVEQQRAVDAAGRALAEGELRLQAAFNAQQRAHTATVGASRRLQRAAADVERLRAMLGARARATYIGTVTGGLVQLIQAATVPQLLNRLSTLDELARQDGNLLGQLSTAERLAAVSAADLAGAEGDARRSTSAVQRQLAELTTIRAARQAAVNATNATVAALGRKAAKLAAPPPAAPAAAAAAPIARIGGVCNLSGISAAEAYIIMHESGGNPTAQNPASTAFGLGQLLLDNRIHYLGANANTTDCGLQLAAFRTYVRERYGTAENAYAFWVSHHWY